MKRARTTTNCSCPAGSKKISTKGRGRGWACQRQGKGFQPFVKAKCP